MSSADTERAWLQEIEAASMVGIAYLDPQGKHIQMYSDDPALRIMVIDYMKERVRLLELDERAIAGQRDISPIKPYPVQED